MPELPLTVYGVDFTSRPTRRKPITCARCTLDRDMLVCHEVKRLPAFSEFEAWLQTPGPWVAGMDFPFGQSRRFVQNIGWPTSWSEYVQYVDLLTRAEFRQILDDYRAPRASGDKEHQRSGDKATGAISPQKLYGVPVGLMFYEGAKRLLHSGAHLPGLVSGDVERQIVEAYPGVLARRVTRDGYKSDTVAKQTERHAQARGRIVDWLQSAACRQTYGVTVRFAQANKDQPHRGVKHDLKHDLKHDPKVHSGNVPNDHQSSARTTLQGDCRTKELVNDPVNDASGDTLDAVLCAVQASWALRQREQIAARLTDDHRLEGWIADPLGLGME